MRPTSLIIAGVLLAGCVHDHPGLEGRQQTGARSTAPLLNTYWKLNRLGDQVVSTPQDAREIHFVLHPENQRVAGFSGCNQMMGAYVLDGSRLKFDQMGGTLMACASNMDVESRLLGMFRQVAGWQIQGETLQLLDAGGKPLAEFESRYLR